MTSEREPSDEPQAVLKNVKATCMQAVECSWEVASLEEVVSRGDPRQMTTRASSTDVDCPRCHIEMTKCWNEFSLVCPKCHVSIAVGIGEAHTISAGENHNTSNNAYMRFKPVGVKDRTLLNTMTKCTSNNESYRDQQILQLLKQFNYINQDFKVPLDALRAAVEMFIQLRDHDYVRRGKTRRGVLGACIYEQCIKHKITKTKSQISRMMQVEESKITFGLEELKGYSKLGVIEVSQNVDPTADYVEQLFEVFDLDSAHRQFVVDLLARMAHKKVEEIESCQNQTKVVGAVYFTSKLLGWGLTHSDIVTNCDGLSRGTYLSVSNAIQRNEKKLRKVFVRHGVPLPAGWEPAKKKDKGEKDGE